MKISEIVELRHDLNAAIDAAGKGEMRWFLLAEKLVELGYDVTKVSNPAASQIAAATRIAELVDSASPERTEPLERERLFAD